MSKLSRRAVLQCLVWVLLATVPAVADEPERLIVRASKLALDAAAALLPAANSRVSEDSDLPLDARFAISRALGKETGSYHAAAVAGGYRLDNRRHALSASFLPTGVEIQTGSARWGLALSGYGYGTDLRAVGTVAPQAQANRVEYRRGTHWRARRPPRSVWSPSTGPGGVSNRRA